jgi:hypothetical protein
LLNLHRPYFAQALQDKPDDLANHRFIPSVMAAYRSAWRLIRGLVIAWRDIPLLLSRYGSAWSPALSAAVSASCQAGVHCYRLTTLPADCDVHIGYTGTHIQDDQIFIGRAGRPGSFVPRRFVELPFCCKPLGGVFFVCVGNHVLFLHRLQQPITVLARKAHQAVNNTSPSPTDCDVTPADLDRLGGKTHLISQLSNVTATPPGDSPTPLPAGYPRTAMLSDIAATTSETMHPTIAQDMRSFDLGEPSQFYGAFPEADMAGIQFTGDSIFSIQAGGYGYSPTPTFQSAPAGFATGPPMLDATWQSFVEQLGF